MKIGKCILTFLFLLSLLTAQAQFGGGGTPSSKNIKKALVKSFLFRSCDLYYPNGLPDDPGELPTLDKRQIKKLSKDLNKIYKYLYKRDDEMEAFLMTKFEKVAVKERLKKIKIRQHNQAVLTTSNKKLLYVDLKVLQAIFRAVLLHSVDDPTLTDREKMKEFFDLKEQIETMKTKSLIGDLLSDLDDSPWFDMVDFSQKSGGLEKRYLSTLMFAMSHELGHLVLCHFENRSRARDTLENYRLEYEADAYAAWMMVYIFQNQAILDSFGDSFMNEVSFRSLIGDEAFFDKAIDLAEFKHDASTHPSKEARKQRIEAIYDSLNLDIYEEW